MQRTYFQAGLHYGAFYGISAFAFVVFSYYCLGNPLGAVSFLGAWIPIVFICIAIKRHRNDDLGGYITYWESFRTGFFTVALGGILFALLFYFFSYVIAYDILNDYKQMAHLQVDEIRKLHLSMINESMLDDINEKVEATTLSNAISGDYANKTFGAIIISLIAAAVLSRRKIDNSI